MYDIKGVVEEMMSCFEKNRGFLWELPFIWTLEFLKSLNRVPSIFLLHHRVN